MRMAWLLALAKPRFTVIGNESNPGKFFGYHLRRTISRIVVNHKNFNLSNLLGSLFNGMQALFQEIL